MYYRVELEIDSDVEHPIGCEDMPGWQGIFRPGGFYIDLLERGARDYDAADRMKKYLREELPWPRLPRGDESFLYQFWFTEHGYEKFEEIADLFLEALSHMPEAKDMRVQASNLAGRDVLYEDDYQVAVRA